MQVHVDGLDAEVRTLKERVGSLAGEVKHQQELIHDNTRITQSVEGKLGALIEATKPVIESMKTMRTGIETIGKLGKLTRILGQTALYGFALFAFAKILLGGGGFDSAVAAFWKFMGK